MSPFRIHPIYRKKRESLLRLLKETSFYDGNTETYQLSSGNISPFYVDCKMIFSYPQGRKLVGELITYHFSHILKTARAVGGLELGAYPFATTVSDALFKKMKVCLRAFVVRKSPKGHGLTKWIEGLDHSHYFQKYPVIILDDVITTGGSTIEAITRCRDMGFHVKHVIALVDRQEHDGRKHIEAQEVFFHTLFTLNDLKEIK